MSSDELPIILLRWCKDRTGIRLKKEYLRTWKAARRDPITNYESAYTDLVTEFLKTDISTTSEPIIQAEFDRNPIDTFPVGHLKDGCGVILQIQDTLDIRHSTFSLLNSFSNATPVRQTYIERHEGDDVNLPRGMLQWVLTDGVKQIYAMELETIPDLDLKTPFGCKLLIKGCRVRRGMLLLTKDNVKVLGGNVVELYGGDMIAELEDRCKRKLGIIEDPVTPIPTENNTRPTRPAQSPMRTEEVENFDDDINYDDLALGSFETSMANSETVESVSKDSNIPLPDISNDGLSDDDFMEPIQTSPPRSSNNASSISSKRSNPVQQSPAAIKKTRAVNEIPIVEVPVSTLPTMKAQDEGENEGETSFMDIDEDENGDLSFVDPSLWENFEMAANNDKIEFDQQGRASCTFDALKQILKSMKDQTSGDIPDTLRVKTQCIGTTRLRMGPNQHFYLELELGEPVVKYEKKVKHDGIIKAVFSSDLMYRLIGKDKQGVKDIFKQGGQKGVAKYVIKPIQKKTTTVVVYLTLDLTVLEEDSSDPNHALMPLIIDYEATTD